MEVDKKLKEALLEKLSNFQESMPVYPIRKLSYEELINNAMDFAYKFMGSDTSESFASLNQRKDSSILVGLPEDTKMRIFPNSNTMIIKRKMRPLEYLIKGNLDKKQLTDITINVMKKLELDKWKLSFEQVEFERLWQIKAGGITMEKYVVPEVLCRIIGAFRRYINKIPVYGRASIFLKIARESLVESVGIDWRQIEEKPIDDVKIIPPEISAETILKNLNSISPNQIITTSNYIPEFFSLGYFSMPKKYEQEYMQPVYVAAFKSVGWTTLNRFILIPATNDVYDSICRTSEAFIATDRGK